MELRRVILVQHPAERMYDLIEGAEHYPAFVPWCTHATVLERNEAVVAATLAIDWHGVRFDLSTRNRKHRPRWLEFAFTQGPFREFRGEWHLKPLGSAGCRVDFSLRYELASELLTRAARPGVERIAETIVEAFVSRADRLGARIPAPAPVEPAGALPPRVP